MRLVEGLIDAQLLKMVETGDLDLTFTTFPTPPGPFQSLQLLKDPYDFQFLATAREAEEREIERGLVAHIREFLLETQSVQFVGEDLYLGDSDVNLLTVERALGLRGLGGSGRR